MSGIKPPPFLLGAALLFWGVQTGFVGPGAIMALIIELPRFSKARWELAEEEFTRIWVFSTLLLLAGVVYAFTLNEGPSRFSDVFQDPDLRNQSRATLSTAKTAASIIRWLPMIFFLFVAAQQYSSRGGVPLETISLILRRRWKRAKKLGLPVPPSRSIDISYVYFILCLFAASIHTDLGMHYFWGAAALVAYALWPFRSPRFSTITWAFCLAGAVALAWYGQRGMGRLQQYIENINPQWLSGMSRSRFDASQSKTSLGQIGRLKGSSQIIIRVEGKEGPVPQYLREASYTTFRGHTWYSAGRSREFERVDDVASTFNLVPGKTNMARIGIACFLPGGMGLLPLPTSTGMLTNLPAFVVEKNPYGAVHAEGPGLIIFEALFGPGPTMDSAPNEFEDTSVPMREEETLDKVIEKLNLKDKSREEILNALQDYFAEFKYSTYLERPTRGRWEQSALTRFLVETRTGHCEYFATATVLLLHRLGIEARYAVGYAVHEPAVNGERNYVVRLRDAHAWCLVWDPKRAVWRDFDTTPASWMVDENRHDWRQKLSDAWERFRFEVLRIRWGQTHLREYILWTVLPILLILLGQIIFKRRKRANKKQGKGGNELSWPGLDSEFYELERSLAKQGLPRMPGEPVSRWLERAIRTRPELFAENESLHALLLLHYRYRFDPLGLNREDRESLRQHARELMTKLEA